MFTIELKRFVANLKIIITGAIVLMLCIGTIAFCVVRFFKADSPKVTTVGIVISQNNYDRLLMVIDSFGNTYQQFQFERYSDKEDALSDLYEKEIAALATVPANMFDKIFNGEECLIPIIFGSDISFYDKMFQEYADAGLTILRSAQAGIYTVSDFYDENYLDENLETAFLIINRDNLIYALDNTKMYQIIPLSPSDSVTLVQYYTASAMVLFFLLLPVLFTKYFEPYPETFYLICKRRAPKNKIFLYRFLNLSIFLFLCITLVLSFLNQAFSIRLILFGLLFAFTLGLCTAVIFTFVKSVQSGIISIVFISLCLLFLAGGIIPPAYLGDMLRSTFPYNPVYHAIQQIANTV